MVAPEGPPASTPAQEGAARAPGAGGGGGSAGAGRTAGAGGSAGAGGPPGAGGAGRSAAQGPAAGPALQLAPGVTVPTQELSWRFSSSSGPGGQHVNTSNTRAEVTFDVLSSPSLPDWAKQRIFDRLGPVVRVAASDQRSQTRNRELAAERLAARLAGALKVARPRRPTRPTAASQRRRLEDKRRRSAQKRSRRSGRGMADDE
jgi:ribosome-associated protein